jgi:hypothetical protein
LTNNLLYDKVFGNIATGTVNSALATRAASFFIISGNSHIYNFGVKSKEDAYE